RRSRAPSLSPCAGDSRRARREHHRPSDARWKRTMATLTVWRFNEPDGATRAATTLADLQSQGLVSVHDAPTVSWPMDRKRPKTRQLQNLAGAGALSGSFWGLLFGLLFFVPLFGMAVGAALGAAGGALADIGIDDDFIDSVRMEVQPGTSALFALTSD